MGRRRWRIVTIAAFLLFIIKDTICQDENDFYYTPVERSFAQVQPPLYSNNRPSTYFENSDSFRISPSQQTIFNDGNVRFPSPNYNQNPAPFQLPTGRSQSGGQFYINQADFNPNQKQRYRPALPINYQTIHQQTTKRPEPSQIHSVAYQNDPSKPEMFLGQITINNPDIDYLQNNRFKNMPFDGNSLKSNGQSGHINHEEDIDKENQDLYDHRRVPVTTYNPNKLVNKQRLNVKLSGTRFPHGDSLSIINKNINEEKENIQSRLIKPITSSTEYKELLDIEPLLEDDISDISSFRELMKSNRGSYDVQVIKPNENNQPEDSKPDASSMNSDNVNKDAYFKKNTKPNLSTTTILSITTQTVTTEADNKDDTQHEEVLEEGEYVEYYDEPEADIKNVTTDLHEKSVSKENSSEQTTDIYDEYDTAEEIEKPVLSNDTENVENINNTRNSGENVEEYPSSLKLNKTEKNTDFNISEKIESTAPNKESLSSMKNTEQNTSIMESTLTYENDNTASNETTTIETPSILGQEIVSVVTTKSVVNGTISVPDITYTSSTPKTSTPINNSNIDENDSSLPVTTENWVVVASVQTSRSVSGARFLPFPAVEQGEKKQVLIDEKDETEEDETITKDPLHDTIEKSVVSSSTENINDKLDSIQSELSSAVLSGSLDDKENKNIELITEASTEQSSTIISSTVPMPTTTTTTTQSSLNVFTLKSTQLPPVSEKSLPDPLPVLIKKFTPRISTSTTPKPKKKPSLVTVMDDLAGFLPPGYKPKLSFKDKRTTTSTSTTTTSTTNKPLTTNSDSSNEDVPINPSQGRSSGISSKNKVIVLDDKSLLHKEHKPKEQIAKEELIKKFQNNDISKFLPPGYKLDSETSSVKEKVPDILDKVQKVDISAFLPKDFKLNATKIPKLEIKTIPADLAALLPANYTENSLKNVNLDNPLNKFKVADIANLVPPGFQINTTEKTSPLLTTAKPSGSIKLVFPSRPGGKQTRKTTPKPSFESGPELVTFKIQKGWPTRASTEFTGWPSPSTTPFSIDKLLEIQRNATAIISTTEMNEKITTRRTTTTSTTPPPPSTTPGICRKECDIAATIKIVSGVHWVPELLDHHTEEWQILAKNLKQELNSVYSKNDLLKKWYKDIRIDGFSKGSVLVDYFIELNDVEDKVDTMQIKKMFHKTLNSAKPGTVVEAVEEESDNKDIDLDVMLGDQPEDDRMSKSNLKMTKTIDKSAGKLELGKYIVDPDFTDFIVLPSVVRGEPTVTVPEEEETFLPQWGIAVIVIALASLLFVVIFGVTVLVNRQKSTKAKQPIPISDDMLRELDKSHMGGFDDSHQMKERDLPYLPSGKRMSTAFIEQLSYPNPGDSWRSEWTPQLQKYMQQHYTPDSGRGSQIYGQTGNGYGYNGSQIYGHTGGGSQIYGYTGEYPPRSHYSRRRSDYDSNF